MEIVFSPQAQADREYWKQTGNVRIMKRITSLLTDIQQHPFTGIGRPEPLKGDLQGMWSRRITDEHRMVYSIASGMIYVYVFSMRFHYSK
jgi:toxin YoeB